MSTTIEFPMQPITAINVVMADVYCGVLTALNISAVASGKSIIDIDTETYSDIKDARAALKRADFLGCDESEKIIASILNASS